MRDKVYIDAKGTDATRFDTKLSPEEVKEFYEIESHKHEMTPEEYYRRTRKFF